jgi:hypothetical protein
VITILYTVYYSFFLIFTSWRCEIAQAQEQSHFVWGGKRRKERRKNKIIVENTDFILLSTHRWWLKFGRHNCISLERKGHSCYYDDILFPRPASLMFWGCFCWELFCKFNFNALSPLPRRFLSISFATHGLI